MKPLTDPERLLDDVLDGDADFRAASLESLLHEARRHQHARRRNRTLVIAALAVAGTVALLWKPRQPVEESLRRAAPDPAPRSFTYVHSAPLPASRWVETRTGSITVVGSAPSMVMESVTSSDSPFLREIGDGELFTLLAGRPVALVRLPSGQSELLLLNEADRTGFPVQ